MFKMVFMSIWSLPLWKCGLKCIYEIGSQHFKIVTSLVEVRIEMFECIDTMIMVFVTSLVEVRIEINVVLALVTLTTGHFPCGSAD